MAQNNGPQMILHIQHPEDHLLTVLADTVPAKKIATNMDPLLLPSCKHAPF